MTDERHLLDLDDATRESVEAVIARARAFKSGISDANVRLKGLMVLGMFFEPSTRTSVSFAHAAKKMGAGWTEFGASNSSLVKGETLDDTMRTIRNAGADAVVVRHSESGFPHTLARYFDGSVINAGDGWHAHPTQGLLDAMTLLEEFERLEGRELLIAGDVRHSRVARSSARAAHLLGMRVTLCAPPLLLPPDDPAWGYAAKTTDLDTALPHADALMLLRIQKERADGSELPPFHDLVAGFGLDERRFASMQPHAIVMHPGPVNRGVEIAPEFVKHRRSRIDRQVENGLYIRMAALERVLSRTPARAA